MAEAGKDKEPTLRHTGLSALEGAEASTGEAEGAVVDVDKEFLSEEFRTNCTPRDVEVREALYDTRVAMMRAPWPD